MKRFLAIALCVLFLGVFGCNFDKSTPPPDSGKDGKPSPTNPSGIKP